MGNVRIRNLSVAVYALDVQVFRRYLALVLTVWAPGSNFVGMFVEIIDI